MSRRSIPNPAPDASLHARIERQVRATGELAGELNIELADLSPNYDSVVFFATREDESIATPLVTLDAPNSNSHQHVHRDYSTMDRRLHKYGTALGDSLLTKHDEEFRQSATNPDQQLTFTHPLEIDGRRIGAAQYSFTEHYDGEGIELPDTDALYELWARHADATTAIATSINGLYALAAEKRKSLPKMLLKKPPLVPNSFIFRWDTIGATDMALDEEMGPYLDNFLNDAHVLLVDMAAEFEDNPDKSNHVLKKIYSDQGDGAYVTAMIPEKFDVYNPSVLRNYRRYTAAQYMAEMARRLDHLSQSQPDGFRPQVVISGDFGYSELNSAGRLVSRTMYSLARNQKEK